MALREATTHHFDGRGAAPTCVVRCFAVPGKKTLAKAIFRKKTKKQLGQTPCFEYDMSLPLGYNMLQLVGSQGGNQADSQYANLQFFVASMGIIVLKILGLFH